MEQALRLIEETFRSAERSLRHLFDLQPEMDLRLYFPIGGAICLRASGGGTATRTWFLGDDHGTAIKTIRSWDLRCAIPGKPTITLPPPREEQ